MELIDLANSVMIFQSQTTLLRWLIFLLGFLTVTLKYFFLLTLVFALQTVSLIWEILTLLLSLFPLIFLQAPEGRGCLFSMHSLCIFFPADWYNLCDQLKNVPWEDILRLGAFATGTEFYEWVQTGSDVSITHYKYQLILHLF